MNLPDKPSELIRLALADLALCAADPNYRIDMEAVRFARKQDAEKVACGLGHGYHRVCAHGWLMEDLEK